MSRKNEKGLTEKEFLEQYDPGEYEKPSVTVDIMVLRMKADLKSMQILLIRRKDHPYIGKWALPGGFIGMKESAYIAACRELEEETGLTGVYLEQLYTMSRPDRDPRMRVIDIAYFALLPYKDAENDVKAGDDASDALWFDINFTEDMLILSSKENSIVIVYTLEKKVFQNGVMKITNCVPSVIGQEALAFDHAQIVLEGLTRIRNKALYTDIAFNLIPKEFVLPDLQKVYEIILGKDLYPKWFRDKIKSKIRPLEKMGKPLTSNRSSTLYEYVEETS